MTANQLAYQANLIKQQEADTNKAKQEIETSKHLHEYGSILVPMAGSKLNHGGEMFGLESFAKGAKAWRDIVGAGASLFGVR